MGFWVVQTLPVFLRAVTSRTRVRIALASQLAKCESPPRDGESIEGCGIRHGVGRRVATYAAM